jgi:hypothetical protein
MVYDLFSLPPSEIRQKLLRRRQWRAPTLTPVISLTHTVQQRPLSAPCNWQVLSAPGTCPNSRWPGAPDGTAPNCKGQTQAHRQQPALRLENSRSGFLDPHHLNKDQLELVPDYLSEDAGCGEPGLGWWPRHRRIHARSDSTYSKTVSLADFIECGMVADVGVFILQRIWANPLCLDLSPT